MCTLLEKKETDVQSGFVALISDFTGAKKKIFLSFCLNVASDFGKTKLLIPLYHVLMLRQSTAVIYYKRQGSNNCAAYAS